MLLPHVTVLPLSVSIITHSCSGYNRYVKQGGHLTKPGWSKPIPIPHPTHLALFGRKIILYRFNQGAHAIAGAQIRAKG